MGIRPEVGPRCWTDKLSYIGELTLGFGKGQYPKQLPSRLRLVNTLYQSPGKYDPLQLDPVSYETGLSLL